MTTATRPTEADMDAAMTAVWEADSAWASDLDSKEAEAAYKAAKAAYRALANACDAAGWPLTACHRCGGPGGWKGWPGWTCFNCGGRGKEPMKRVRFQASPKTREKNDAKRRERMAEEAAQRGENWKSFEQEHPVEAAFLTANFKTAAELTDYDEPGFDHFFSGLKEQAAKYGRLSEKQVACITREIEKRAEEAAATEFPQGVHTVEGEIVSLPETRGYGGGTKLNMLVKLSGDHAGNKVMGTIPEKVWAAISDEENQRQAHLKGTRVRFTATFEQSDRDEHFGFFKSPKQVEVTYVNWNDA